MPQLPTPGACAARRAVLGSAPAGPSVHAAAQGGGGDARCGREAGRPEPGAAISSSTRRCVHLCRWRSASQRAQERSHESMRLNMAAPARRSVAAGGSLKRSPCGVSTRPLCAAESFDVAVGMARSGAAVDGDFVNVGGRGCRRTFSWESHSLNALACPTALAPPALALLSPRPVGRPGGAGMGCARDGSRSTSLDEMGGGGQCGGDPLPSVVLS